MQAMRIHSTGEPEVMRLEEVPELFPEKKQIVVTVKAVGVNPVDTYLRAGLQGYAPSLPYTPGMDAAGIVQAVGEGVFRVKPGDRVYVAGSQSGTYAAQALCTDTQVHPLPDELSFAQGAAIGIPYATAWRALFQRAMAQTGEWVLIHGASGGVGIAAVQLALHTGLKAIATVGSEAGRELLQAQGATHVVNHHDPQHFDQILAITQGQGVNVILEMLANVNLGRDLTVLARNGRVIVVGSRGTVEINPRELMSRDASVMGMSLLIVTPADKAAIHENLGKLLSQGQLQPVIWKELPLTQAAEAHRLVLSAGALGKIVLVP